MKAVASLLMFKEPRHFVKCMCNIFLVCKDSGVTRSASHYLISSYQIAKNEVTSGLRFIHLLSGGGLHGVGRFCLLKRDDMDEVKKMDADKFSI